MKYETTRKAYSVVFSVYTPQEGQLLVDADSPEQAREMAAKLLEKHKEPNIVDVYEVQLPQGLFVEEQEDNETSDKKVIN